MYATKFDGHLEKHNERMYFNIITESLCTILEHLSMFIITLPVFTCYPVSFMRFANLCHRTIVAIHCEILLAFRIPKPNKFTWNL